MMGDLRWETPRQQFKPPTLCLKPFSRAPSVNHHQQHTGRLPMIHDVGSSGPLQPSINTTTWEMFPVAKRPNQRRPRVPRGNWRRGETLAFVAGPASHLSVGDRVLTGHLVPRQREGLAVGSATVLGTAVAGGGEQGVTPEQNLM